MQLQVQDQPLTLCLIHPNCLPDVLAQTLLSNDAEVVSACVLTSMAILDVD